VSGFNIEADGYQTVYAGGTFDVSGTLTLTPTGGGEPPAPEPPRWPDATTTGVRRPTTLLSTARPGDTINATTYTVHTPGAVFEGVEFQHLVVVRAAGVTFRDCRFSGLDTVPPGSTALLSVRDDRPANGPVPSATLEHCTLRPRRTGVLHDAIRGSNLTVRRCDISGVVDGVHIFGSTAVADPWAGNVLIEACYMHDFIVVRDPGRPSGYSHNDAVQIVGGSGITIRGCDLGAARKASVMVVPTRNNTGRITIEDCRIGASESGVNVNDSRNPDGPIRGLVIEGNEIARQQHGILVSGRTLDQAAPAISGNVWADDGSPVPVRRGA